MNKPTAKGLVDAMTGVMLITTVVIVAVVAAGGVLPIAIVGLIICRVVLPL